MIDTISLKIKLKEENGEYIEMELMEIIKESIKELKYCDLKVSQDNSINLKLSYPRFYYSTNAYLIENPKQCKNVNAMLVTRIRHKIVHDESKDSTEKEKLKKYFEENIEFVLTRVDVPITYYMKKKLRFLDNMEIFNSYKNCYLILDSMYREVYKNFNAKKIGLLKNDEIETIIFTDNSNVSGYNNRIIIYNQMKKMKDYYEKNNPELYNQMIIDHPDLYQRMRIEGAKKVRRKGFSAKEWFEFDIYNEYVPRIGKYILETLFDEDIFEMLIKNKVEELKNKILKEKNEKNFNYNNFILKYQNEIWDYEIIRKAIMSSYEIENSAYQACSTVRAILEKLEIEKKRFFFKVIDEIEMIREKIRFDTREMK